MPNLSAWSPTFLGALRIVSGLLFLEHGTQKLLNFPAGERGGVELASLMGVAGVLETVGGALIVLGLLTRPAAFLLSGMMAIAYWTAHAPRSLYPISNEGGEAILFCFIFLYLVFAGPGRFALDALIGARKPAV